MWTEYAEKKPDVVALYLVAIKDDRFPGGYSYKIAPFSANLKLINVTDKEECGFYEHDTYSGWRVLNVDYYCLIEDIGTK